MTDLTVVIATHGRATLLARTLASIADGDPPGGRWRLLVVENGPVTGAADVVRRFAGRLPVSYRYQPEASKSAALNLAIAESDTPLLVFTDDDVRVARRWLTAYADAAARLGRGHYFCGPNTPDYERKPPAWLLARMPACVAGLQLGPVERALTLDELGLGANWAAWRDELRQVGGFDPALGPGPARALLEEENEAQRALRARGTTGVWVPDAGVHHWVPAHACTPRWAIARASRQARTDAWLQPADLAAARWFGAPRHLWRSLGEAVIRWAVATVLAAPAADRLAAGLRAARAWGRIQGHRGRGRPAATPQGREASVTQRVSPATMPPE